MLEVEPWQVPCYVWEGPTFRVQNIARIKLKPGGVRRRKRSPEKESGGGFDQKPEGASWLFLETNNTNTSIGSVSRAGQFGANFRDVVHKEGVETGQVQVVAGPQLQEILQSKHHHHDDRYTRVLERLAANKPQTSTDGVGINATLVFLLEVHWSSSNSLINPFSGVSMKVVHDSRTSRDYLYFAEGPSHAIRMIDVTSNEANMGKVTTVVSMVGPQFMACGSGSHDFFVLDGKGVLSQVDLQPVIHCGNQVKFFKPGFESWMPVTGTSKSALLGPQTQIYNLIRNGASANAKAHPWELIVQKKIVKVKGVKGAMVTKSISCSRPVVGINVTASATKFCCVKKESSGPDMSTLNMEKQEKILDAIMKI